MSLSHCRLHLLVVIAVDRFIDGPVNYNHTLNLHGYGDIQLQSFWGYDLDHFGPPDVISHMTTEFEMCVSYRLSL